MNQIPPIERHEVHHSFSKFCRSEDVAELEKQRDGLLEALKKCQESAGLPMERDCPECDGFGIVSQIPEICSPSKECPKCNGTGKQQIYYTPLQYEALTGKKMLESDPLWVRSNPGGKGWGLYEAVFFIEESGTYDCQYDILIARPSQPKPPSDYQVEEE